MSKSSDINQLLKEIGTSGRSAGDPWTISRGAQGIVDRDSFSPAVVADLGTPASNLSSDIQSSEQIAKSNEIVTNPAASSAGGSGKSSASSGILGGLLNLFPLASVFGKLFGLGGSSSPPQPPPYLAPPPISFEGAISSSLSGSTTSSLLGSSFTSSAGSQGDTGISSLSYGSDGLPRVPASTGGQFQDVTGQVNGLTTSNFLPEPAASSPVPSADLIASTSLQGPGVNSSTTSVRGNDASPPTTGANSSTAQQGQSILVQVQAMDSQSFMDHSQDIAQAVRQAMLNMHSVNDVIANL